MWMVGYNEGGGGEHHHHHHLNMVADHHPLFNGRKNNNNNNNNKFRPLIPRPMTSSPNNNYSPTTTTPTPCLSRNNIQGNDFFSHHHQHHHHHLVVGEEKKSSGRSGGGEVVSSSSRWNPTADQVRALEELYRRGIRTPSAEEIQRITGELRRMGKIEGKNVFYWFQNHKARDRQKRRRQMMHHLQSPSSNPLNTHFDALHHKKDSAANRRRVHQVEQTKNCPLPTNSTTLPETQESVSIERAAKADGWVQFDGSELEQEQEEEEEEQSRNFMDRNGTWRMLLQCPVTNLINTTTTTSLMDPNNLIHTRDHHLSFFALTHHTQEHHQQHNNNINNNNHFVEPQPAAAPTLQLFPLRSGDVDHHKQTHISESDINANNFTPTQFFEFLPLNNN